jgi:hypothetical protein
MRLVHQDRIERTPTGSYRPLDDHATFAYLVEGAGCPNVLIHRLRARLGWSRERFDRVLQDLAASQVLDLHEGDPAASGLSDDERYDAYRDADGRYFLTVTLRARHRS